MPNPSRTSTRPLMLAGFSLFAASVLLPGCVAPPPHHPAPPRVAAAPAPINVRVMPEVIVENPGRAPTPNSHWVKGYWQWRGNEWQWQVGHWVTQPVPPMPEIIIETRSPAPSVEHFWVPGHWVWRVENNNWMWMNGRWYR